MKTVFGNSDVSYEQLMSGYQNYCYTVLTYGLNATEPLPFHYLTNNNKISTPVLNEMFEKLAVVNQNRENHTLTSEHTDDFISYVYDTFVVNDGSLNLSQGTKGILGCMVKSFTTMQAQISNGEPLYLHENRGYARAGINLAESDGHFAIGMPDKTTYEFTSLLDVMNHGYGDKDENAERCLSEQEIILSNITAMNLIDNPSPDASRLRLAVYLENHGLYEAGRQVRNNTFDAAYLYDVGLKNPQVAAYVNDYLFGEKTQGNGLVNFETLTDGVDRLVGVSERNRNNYSDLINVRRSAYSLNNDYTIVSGKRYTADPNKKANNPGRRSGGSTTTTTTTVTHEQITVDQMTPEEKQEAEQQVQQLQQQEEAEHTQQQQEIEEGVAEIHAAAEQGASQEQLAAIAEKHGIEADPNLAESYAEAFAEQAQGEEHRQEVEQQVEDTNRAEEEAAERRRQEEADRQAQELAEMQALIDASEAIEETPAEEVVVDTPESTQEDFQTDSDRVDLDAGEEDYIPTASVKEQLLAMKRAALNQDVDVDSLDGPSGPRLG